MKMVPTPMLKNICDIVITSTIMTMDRNTIIRDLDIDPEELDEAIAFCKKNNE